MNKHKKIIQIAISAILAIGFIKFYLQEKEDAISNAYGMVEVLTASRDIPPRTELTEKYVISQKVPMRYVAPGAVIVKIPTDAMSKVKGKVTIAATPEGSQIVLSNLMVPSIKDTGVSPLIPPGKRAYILRLGNVDVANLILPGDYIDIMATFTVRKDNATSKMTNTILQNILVLGVGRDIKKSNDDVTSKKEGAESLMLTLALSPIEAQTMALSHSEAQGEIAVVVRPHGENEIRQVPATIPSNLLGMPQQPVAQKSAK